MLDNRIDVNVLSSACSRGASRRALFAEVGLWACKQLAVYTASAHILCGNRLLPVPPSLRASGRTDRRLQQFYEVSCPAGFIQHLMS